MGGGGEGKRYGTARRRRPHGQVEQSCSQCPSSPLPRPFLLQATRTQPLPCGTCATCRTRWRVSRGTWAPSDRSASPQTAASWPCRSPRTLCTSTTSMLASSRCAARAVGRGGLQGRVGREGRLSMEAADFVHIYDTNAGFKQVQASNVAGCCIVFGRLIVAGGGKLQLLLRGGTLGAIRAEQSYRCSPSFPTLVAPLCMRFSSNSTNATNSCQSKQITLVLPRLLSTSPHPRHSPRCFGCTCLAPDVLFISDP